MGLDEQLGGEQDIDYEEFEGILAEADCESSATELQAFLCGLLAAGIDHTDTSWQLSIGELFNEGNDFPDIVTGKLLEIFSWTSAELKEQDSLAPMLLPDDRYPAVDQLEALVEWCDGFLLGFGVKIGDQKLDSSEINEALKDLSEICQLDLDVEENEETREALFTLVEHIRVAVQVVHWEMVVNKQVSVDLEAPKKPTIH